MKHFRKVGKKNTVTKVDVQVLFNEFKAAIQDFAEKVKSGTVPTIPITTALADEPLSFSEYKPMFLAEQSNQITFKQMANEMDKIQFSDEKDDFAVKIKNCTLSESDKTKLLQALWLK